MSIVMICLVIAVLIPNMLAFGSIRYRLAQFGGIDTKMPRDQASKLTGPGQRIVAAQANAWEALLVYLATLILVFAAEVPIALVAKGSIVFVSARVLHSFFYLANFALLRTLSWLVATGSCVWLMVQAF